METKNQTSKIKNQKSEKGITSVVKMEKNSGVKFYVPKDFVRHFFVLILLPAFLFSVFCFLFSVKSANAAVGINRTINFQGKVVNKTTETNITDGSYSF